MSWETQAWAAKQRVGSSSGKLLLLALASCTDADHCAYPSVAWLTDFTDLNRKTVISTLDRLVELGLIIDTGERKGRTKQVKVYRLAAGQAEQAKPEPSQKRDSIPKAEPLKSPKITGEESQKRDTEPFKEPTSQKATPSSRAREKPKNTGPLPEGWKPDPPKAGSKSERIIASWDADRLALEIEKFTAHHGARDNRFSSWQQAWLTWVLRTLNDAGGKPNAAGRDPTEPDRRDGLERALDRSIQSGAGGVADPASADGCRARDATVVPIRAGTLL